MYSSVPNAPLQSPNSPTSPSVPTTRLPSRLRGLSYLLSRDHGSRPSTLTRASSYPTPSSPASPSTPTQRPTNEVSTARTSNPENLGTASGWIPPPVVGQGADSQAASHPLPSTRDSAHNTSLAPSTAMARTRSATVGEITGTPEGSESRTRNAATVNGENRGMAHQLPSIRFTAHQAPGAQRPSLVFSPMARILPTGQEIIKVGRYSERDNQPHQAMNVPSSAPVGFKSKVVSRRHCEFWCSGGRWYIKDVKSSSGTFLNHIRLSSPATESRPYPVNDGDIVQLGIDFKGGEEMIFRCVKIRVELNKGWQNGPSSFNVQSHKRLRELNNVGKPAAGGSSQDCSICLGPIAPCQSLFVAPCSHTWHYKCIRVIINGPMFPHFVCPNCRSVADLEAELDDPYANGEWEEVPAEIANEDTRVTEPEAPPIVAISRQEHTQTSTEDTGLTATSTEAVERTSSFHREDSGIEHSDLELPDASDSEIRPTGDDGRYVNVGGSPSPSSDSLPDQVSSATIPAVDIISRRSITETNAGMSAYLQRPGARTERSATRTPSPNGLPSSLTDGMMGSEGPMTPRNDAGPFIFDGSAGRATVVAATLNEAADTPPSITSRPSS